MCVRDLTKLVFSCCSVGSQKESDIQFVDFIMDQWDMQDVALKPFPPRQHDDYIQDQYRIRVSKFFVKFLKIGLAKNVHQNLNFSGPFSLIFSHCFLELRALRP